MLYTVRFFLSSKCSLFHNANLFGSCIIHILYTGCAKLKKNNSGATGLTELCVCVCVWKGTEREREREKAPVVRTLHLSVLDRHIKEHCQTFL